jgi:hypothetical protein
MKDRTLYIVIGVGVAIVIGALIIIGFRERQSPRHRRACLQK